MGPPRISELLNMFPSVLIMDSTYNKNKCMQLLFEVVGKTSTELTFFVAFAYMATSDLDKLKQLFTKQRLWPRVILIDTDLSLIKAIETVFPRTNNLLCRFHINKNVKGKCKNYVVNDMREMIEKLWHELVRANDEVEYHQHLQQFEHACMDFRPFFDYAKDTWFTPHRHRFLRAWVNQVLHLGNTTTNR